MCAGNLALEQPVSVTVQPSLDGCVAVHLGPLQSLGVCSVSASQPLPIDTSLGDDCVSLAAAAGRHAQATWQEERKNRVQQLHFSVYLQGNLLCAGPRAGGGRGPVDRICMAFAIGGYSHDGAPPERGLATIAFLAAHLTLCGLALHPVGTWWLTVAAEFALWGAGFALLRGMVGGFD